MIIIKLKDSAIENIETDMTCLSEGCWTCGYGSDYCTTITVRFDDNDRLRAERHSEYDYDEDFSIGYFVRLFCQNFENIQEMDKEDFIQWFKNEVSSQFSSVEFNEY